MQTLTRLPEGVQRLPLQDNLVPSYGAIGTDRKAYVFHLDNDEARTREEEDAYASDYFSSVLQENMRLGFIPVPEERPVPKFSHTLGLTGEGETCPTKETRDCTKNALLVSVQKLATYLDPAKEYDAWPEVWVLYAFEMTPENTRPNRDKFTLMFDHNPLEAK